MVGAEETKNWQNNSTHSKTVVLLLHKSMLIGITGQARAAGNGAVGSYGEQSGRGGEMEIEKYTVFHHDDIILTVFL